MIASPPGSTGRRSLLRPFRSRRPTSPALISAVPEEIVFTGCATEANNIALHGAALALAGRCRRLVTQATEHPAVLETCRYLEKTGCRVTYLPVDRHGMVDPAAVARAITSKTVLVSIMLANNEVGTIEPVVERFLTLMMVLTMPAL